MGGAYAHILLQVVTVYLLFIPQPQILYLAPVLIPPSLAFGVVNGLAAGLVCKRLRAREELRGILF